MLWQIKTTQPSAQNTEYKTQETKQKREDIKEEVRCCNTSQGIQRSAIAAQNKVYERERASPQDLSAA
jgi:hypothetical protein